MGVSSPVHNVKGYSVSKPPVIIFVMCLLLCATAVMAMGFYIQYSDSILNPHIKAKWLKFLSHLSAPDYCLTLSDDQESPGPVTRVIDGGPLNSTDESTITVSASVRVTRSSGAASAGGVAAAYGDVSGGDWAFLTDPRHPLGSIRLIVGVPVDVVDRDESVCVVLTVPTTFLPSSKRSSVCVPQFLNNTVARAGRLTQGHPTNGSLDQCEGGFHLRMLFNPEGDFLLSDSERKTIRLRLFHTAYFLLALSFVFLCFALIRVRQYASVASSDKVPLTL